MDFKKHPINKVLDIVSLSVLYERWLLVQGFNLILLVDNRSLYHITFFKDSGKELRLLYPLYRGSQVLRLELYSSQIND